MEKLKENLMCAMGRLKDFNVEEARDGRLIVHVGEVQEAAKIACKVFGVSSISPAARLNLHDDKLLSRLMEAVKEINRPKIGRFASIKNFGKDRRSEDLAGRLREALPCRIDVKGFLKGWEADVVVEVFDGGIYMSFNSFKGLGGLPINSQGRVVCLVSGGIDSPVAAWMAMRKGCEPIFIYYDNYPFTDETTYRRALDVMKRLRDYAPGRMLRLYVIPHGGDLAEILRKCPRRLSCVLCRRMMYRVAEKVAEREGAEAIVSGEILGEHASQTLRNLYVEDEALRKLPILRPLIGMDKLDVENLARKIGTFEISTRRALCCSAPPKHPKTEVKLEEVMKAEGKLLIESLIEEDLKRAKIIEI